MKMTIFRQNDQPIDNGEMAEVKMTIFRHLNFHEMKMTKWCNFWHFHEMKMTIFRQKDQPIDKRERPEMLKKRETETAWTCYKNR